MRESLAVLDINGKSGKRWGRVVLYSVFPEVKHLIDRCCH